MTSFYFTDEMNSSRAAQVIDVLRAPRLWIPTDQDYGGGAHELWLERTESELTKGSRHALLAQVGRRSVGAIVFRPEPDDPQTVGIRNISIHPDISGRRFGSFMLRNSEHIATEIYPQASRFIVDTKETNDAMLRFLGSQDYVEIARLDIYSSDKTDVILEKSVTVDL